MSATLALRTADGAKHPVRAVIPHHMDGALPLVLQQPVELKAGDHIAESRFIELFLQIRQLHELLVAPQDLLGVHIEHQHGQGRIEHIVGAGRVHAAAHTVEVLPHSTTGADIAADADIQHQCRQQRLDEGKGGRILGHEDHEDHKADHEQGCIGAETANELFIQRIRLPHRKNGGRCKEIEILLHSNG